MGKSVQASINKWKKNAGAAGDAYVEGIQGVTVSPTAKAAEAVDRYARGVQDAVSSGRFVQQCQAVTLADWQTAATGKGKGNYQNGVAKISNKAMKNMSDLLTYTAQVKAEIAGMPNDTESDKLARMMANREKMLAYRKR